MDRAASTSCRSISLAAELHRGMKSPPLLGPRTARRHHGFTTYVNVTAALHWLNSIPNTLIASSSPRRRRICANRYAAEAEGEGWLSGIPQEPGLGIELDEAALEKYASC